MANATRALNHDNSQTEIIVKWNHIVKIKFQDSRMTQKQADTKEIKGWRLRDSVSTSESIAVAKGSRRGAASGLVSKSLILYNWLR